MSNVSFVLLLLLILHPEPYNNVNPALIYMLQIASKTAANLSGEC